MGVTHGPPPSPRESATSCVSRSRGEGGVKEDHLDVGLKARPVLLPLFKRNESSAPHTAVYPLGGGSLSREVLVP